MADPVTRNAVRRSTRLEAVEEEIQKEEIEIKNALFGAYFRNNFNDDMSRREIERALAQRKRGESAESALARAFGPSSYRMKRMEDVIRRWREDKENKTPLAQWRAEKLSAIPKPKPDQSLSTNITMPSLKRLKDDDDSSEDEVTKAVFAKMHRSFMRNAFPGAATKKRKTTKAKGKWFFCG